MATAIGKLIRDLRKAQGLTQQQTAKKVQGLSQMYVSQVEKGYIPKPSTDKLRLMARALNAPYNDLIVAAGYLDPVAGEEEPTEEFDAIKRDVLEFARTRPDAMATLAMFRDTNRQDVYDRLLREIRTHIVAAVEAAGEEERARAPHE